MAEADDLRRLSSLADEMLALARRLGGEVPESTPIAQTGVVGPCGNISRSDVLACARYLYRLRRLRNRVFEDPDLFGEPAWDMLLDLYIAANEGKRVSVTSACIGAAVPTTTALRWIGILEQRGLLRREADTLDGRRIFVRLTEHGCALMEQFFGQISDPADP